MAFDTKKSHSIMLIDDSRLSRTAVRMRLLKRFPHWHIDEAADAEDALAIAAQKSYDLFMVDINMPGMSGLELAPLLREHHPHCKLVFLTANIQATIRKRIDAIQGGFIKKPVGEDIADRLLEEISKS